jgi:hypothetical protein
MNAPIKCLHTEVWPIERVLPHPLNPNRHPEAQIKLLAEIITRGGWRNPIVVSQLSGFVIKGHGRLAAAKFAGLTEVPIDSQPYANEQAEIADLVADNRIAELSENDDFAIHALLEELKADPGFDAMLAGFTTEAFDELAAQIASDGPSDGVNSQGEATVSNLADTNFKFGSVRFPIPRENYLRWQEEIRKAVGFNKAEIAKEIARRLGIRTS